MVHLALRNADARRRGWSEDVVKALCSPRSASELAVIESLLRAEGLQYFIHNNHFGALEVGPTIPLVNERTVFVADEAYERAASLIAQPVRPAGATSSRSHVSPLGKVRMLLEVLAFGWLFPGSRRHRLAAAGADRSARRA